MKSSLHMGITTKLVLILLFFSLIPLSVQVYSLFQTANILENEVGVQYQAVAKGMVDNIRQRLHERVLDALTLSRNPVFLNRDQWYQPGNPENVVVSELNEYVRSSDMYSLIEIVDTEGHLIAVNDRDGNGQPLETQNLYRKDFRTTSWFRAFQQHGVKNPTNRNDSTVENGILWEGVIIDQDVLKLFPEESGLALGITVPMYEQGGPHRVLESANIHSSYRRHLTRGVSKIGQSWISPCQSHFTGW